MTINTTIGKTYAVTSATECTITTPAGALIAACPAGEQTIFIAPCAQVEVSHEAALVTETFKNAPAGSAAAGGVRALYEHIAQTPAEGNLSNVNTYGFAIVTTQSGRLDSITLAPRTSGGVEDHWPIYLKIWVADGDQWNVLGTSLNAVAQTAGTPSIWRFAGINLEAGRKIQIEARKKPESTIHDSRLSVSVVANTLADTGCIDAQGRLSMTDWVPQYTLSLSRETGIGYRGIQLAEQANLDAHTHDAVRHITPDERTEWNNKVDASALSGKVNTATFNSHTGNNTAHITADERAAWNDKQDRITNTDGNMNLEGYMLMFNSADGGRIASLYDHIWLIGGSNSYTNELTVHIGDQLVEYANVEKKDAKTDSLNDKSVLNRSEMDARYGQLSAANTWTNPQTHSSAINANGGINAITMLAPELPKTGLNAGAAALISVLGNVYHLDHVNGSTITVLDGSNIKQEHVLTGWCGLSWAGTLTAHKCILIKPAVTNTNYGGAFSPMGTSDYALVMSYLSGVNMVDSSTKFGFTGYSGTVTATTIEHIPGPSFFTDCVNKKIVVKNAEGETTEIPWANISLDQVSRLDLILIPSSRTACKIYLSIHPSVATAHGGHYNFNRRYLTPQTYYIGEAPVGLTGNDCHYALLDNNSEQMALFRVSVIQGINTADYLAIETN